jgi:ribosomal protein L21E
VVRTAGALPVVKGLCDRLGLVEAVDRFCPIRSVADLTHGQVFEALVCNRLTNPRPLSSFTDWGERFAVQEVLGVPPVKLNDDRLGRALDAVSGHLDEILNLVARRAIEVFGLDLAELHWDVTQLSFTGGYADQEDGFAQVRYGRTPKRTIERQLHAGFWVAGDGAVAFRGQAFDGNTNDVVTVEPALARLDAIRAALPTGTSPLVVGDSKLLSATNVAAFERRELRFLCPQPKNPPLQQRLAALKEGDLVPLDYAAERHQGKPSRYFGSAGTTEVGGRTLRALFVLSLDDKEAARKQRDKHLARAHDEITSLNRGVPQYTKDAHTLERKARAKLEKRHIDQLLTLTIDETDGKPQARLTTNHDTLAAAIQLDGRYCLVTNDQTLTDDQLFCAYKRQHLIESRFTDLKGPIQVRPVFLHTNRRIAALLAVISTALLLYALIERQVRQGLSHLTPQQQRLLTSRIGRATGRKILDQLSDLATVRVRDGPPRLAQPRPAQQLLLQLLNP